MISTVNFQSFLVDHALVNVAKFYIGIFFPGVVVVLLYKMLCFPSVITILIYHVMWHNPITFRYNSLIGGTTKLVVVRCVTSEGK